MPALIDAVRAYATEGEIVGRARGGLRHLHRESDRVMPDTRIIVLAKLGLDGHDRGAQGRRAHAARRRAWR